MPALIESVIKSMYRDWKQSPGMHTHSAFVELCVSTLKRPESDIREKLKSFDWYNTK